MFMSLIEMQAHIDFDEAHKSKENGDELEIRCNGQGCIAWRQWEIWSRSSVIGHRVYAHMHRVLLKTRKNNKILIAPASAAELADDRWQWYICRWGNTWIYFLGARDRGAREQFFINRYLEAFQNMNEIQCAEKMYKEDTVDIRSIQTPKTADLSMIRNC